MAGVRFKKPIRRRYISLNRIHDRVINTVAKEFGYTFTTAVERLIEGDRALLAAMNSDRELNEYITLREQLNAKEKLDGKQR